MIEFLDDPQQESFVVEYVGGPRSGQRETLEERPPVIATDPGDYRRSVQCADHGAVRYVWAIPDGPR